MVTYLPFQERFDYIFWTVRKFNYKFCIAEEEIKRLHQALDSESSYNQVGYSYNEDENGHKASGEDSQSPKQSEDSQEEDQAFVPPPELEIPEGMVLVRISLSLIYGH